MDCLYKTLPDSIEIDGFKIEIETDFRFWIEFQERFFNEETTNDERLEFVAASLKDPKDILYIGEGSFNRLLTQLCEFLSMKPIESIEEKEEAQSNNTKAPSYDFSVDAGRIFSLFKIYYGIDLYEIEYLHWWKFIALLSDAPEGSDFAKAVSVRNRSLKGLKGEELKRLKRQKELYKIEPKGVKKPLEEIINDKEERIRRKLGQL